MKNIFVEGFPGGGKILVIMYIVIYARSKEFTVIIAAMMWHWLIQISGLHWDKLLCIPVDHGNNMSTYQMTELAIKKNKTNRNIIEVVWSIHVIANYKIGQTTVKFENIIEIIFKIVCGINVYKLKQIFLQHTTQHNCNLIEDIHFWCPLVLFNVTKLFPSTILSAHRMKFSGFNILLERVIKNLLIIHSWMINLNGFAKASYLYICGMIMKLRDTCFAGIFLAYIQNISGVISGSSHKYTNMKPLQSRSNSSFSCELSINSL